MDIALLYCMVMKSSELHRDLIIIHIQHFINKMEFKASHNLTKKLADFGSSWCTAVEHIPLNPEVVGLDLRRMQGVFLQK